MFNRFIKVEKTIHCDLKFRPYYAYLTDINVSNVFLTNSEYGLVLTVDCVVFFEYLLDKYFEDIGKISKINLKIPGKIEVPIEKIDVDKPIQHWLIMFKPYSTYHVLDLLLRNEVKVILEFHLQDVLLIIIDLHQLLQIFQKVCTYDFPNVKTFCLIVNECYEEYRNNIYNIFKCIKELSVKLLKPQ